MTQCISLMLLLLLQNKETERDTHKMMRRVTHFVPNPVKEVKGRVNPSHDLQAHHLFSSIVIIIILITITKKYLRGKEREREIHDSKVDDTDTRDTKLKRRRTDPQESEDFSFSDKRIFVMMI